MTPQFSRLATGALLWCGLMAAGVPQTVASAPPPQDLGSVAVNGTAGSATLQYQFNGLSSSPTFQLRYSADFSLGQPACSGTTPMTCSVPVSFSPKFPGLRQDAVRVLDGNAICWSRHSCTDSAWLPKC
ncbi:MAG: hypothetical protein JOZ62_10625 [Acidobacteriaceae bacterium]|nr:hypothetical protein [Acidobacteriaceae bacterium]